MSLVEIRAPPQKCPKNPKMHPPPSFDLTLYSVGFRPRAARIHLELRFPKEPAFPLPFSQPSRRTFHRARWHLAGNSPSWKLLLHPLISSPGRRRQSFSHLPFADQDIAPLVLIPSNHPLPRLVHVHASDLLSLNCHLSRPSCDPRFNICLPILSAAAVRDWRVRPKKPALKA
ncbi:hypothetical protein E4U61_004318 [Claviceps capensis]|nr:hypothetical protein E4U61_004318 [Claviceps capensis]